MIAQCSRLTPEPQSSLYARLLGPAWHELDVVVRLLHAAGGARAVGHFRVRHGGNRLARLLTALARLPSPGEAVTVRLSVETRADLERWHRAFGNVALVSLQGAGHDGLLVERIGGLTIRFRLSVAEGALLYRQVGCVVRLGPLSLPLPARLAPRVAACEAAAAAGDGVLIEVQVALPLVGLLLAYEGCIHPEDGPA